MRKRIIALALLLAAFGAAAPAQADYDPPERPPPPDVCDVVDCNWLWYQVWWVGYQADRTVWAYYWMAQYYSEQVVCTVDRLVPPSSC